MTRLIAALLCLGLASVASAADKKKKNANKNQQPDIAALFAKLDVNKDNKLDLKEFEAFKGFVTEAQKATKAKKVGKKANKKKGKKKGKKKAAK